MKTTQKKSIRLGGVVAVLSGLFLASGHAQVFPTLLFSDNFYTGIAAPGDTTNLNTNIGATGGRQGGWLVTDVNSNGFGYDVFGKTTFTNGNGWDLRSQENWPNSTNPVDQYTLRFRDNEAGQWSSISPQIGFGTYFQDNSYRIQVQLVHAHLDPTGINDRWAGIVFGVQPEVRFPAFVGNGGVTITPHGAVTVFADGVAIGGGSVTPPQNGAFDLDLRVLNNVGELFVNGSSLASGLDFSNITPSVVSLVALAGTDPDVFSSTQVRFDNFAVSTIPEPSTYAMIGGLLALGAAGLWRRRRRRS